MTTMTKRLMGLGVAILMSTVLANSANAAWVNGWWVYPYKYYGNQTWHNRPMSAWQKYSVCSDWRIDRVPINQKGIGIGATANPYPQKAWAFRTILINHVEISNVWRSGPGIHNDFIQVCGGGNNQDVPTDLTIQDAYLHDGQGIPVMIQDGWFDKITLKDIRVSNVTVCLQISTINTGRIGTIVIDHCPGLSIAIMGRPGTIGTVYVKNSPGARVGDVANKNGRSGCRIIYQ